MRFRINTRFQLSSFPICILSRFIFKLLRVGGKCMFSPQCSRRRTDRTLDASNRARPEEFVQNQEKLQLSIRPAKQGRIQKLGGNTGVKYARFAFVSHGDSQDVFAVLEQDRNVTSMYIQIVASNDVKTSSSNT